MHQKEFKEFESKEKARKDALDIAAASKLKMKTQPSSKNATPQITDFVGNRGKDKITAKIWSQNSPEYQKRKAAMVSFFSNSLQRAHLADSPEFKAMLTAFEPRFKPLGSKALNKQLDVQVNETETSFSSEGDCLPGHLDNKRSHGFFSWHISMLFLHRRKQTTACFSRSA